jgi:GT2 family glycosyltransferase
VQRDGAHAPAQWSAERDFDPARAWRDRRWRPIAVRLPDDVSGDVLVTLEARLQAPGGGRVQALWGDPAVEWPRSREERLRLLRGALGRIRWAGLGGAFEYAKGRQRIDDQAAAYSRWVRTHRLDDEGLEALRADVGALPYTPVISVITPVFNTPPHILTACVTSVGRQAYERWQLCLADDGSTSEATRQALRELATDSRLRVARLEQNEGISAASNAAFALADGEFVALLDHDDELAPEALAEVVRCLNAHPDADVIYSDEDKLDASGDRCEPQFKPDWSPELLLTHMYACHLLVVRRSLMAAIGGFRKGFEGAQDYDLLLRLMEKTDRILHVPKVLYHWRKSPASTATVGTSKPWALEAGARALEDYALRTGREAAILEGPFPGTYRFRRAIQGDPLVSVVIPTTGRAVDSRGDLLARGLRGLGNTAWSRFEVVVAADQGEISEAARDAMTPLRHRILAYDGGEPFNFAKKINWAVQQTDGDLVVLFNDDLEPIDPDWLTAMLELAQEPAIGAVGAKLLYPDGRLQHVGMLVGVAGIASHALHQQPSHIRGYAGSAVLVRDCSAVTAACLMTRRTVFDELGGLDEQLPIDFNDVDFSLRLRAAGYRVVFTPYARLYHHESASLGRRRQSSQELERMRQKWGTSLDRDPYYNPNLSRNFTDYRLQL